MPELPGTAKNRTDEAANPRTPNGTLFRPHANESIAPHTFHSFSHDTTPRRGDRPSHQTISNGSNSAINAETRDQFFGGGSAIEPSCVAGLTEEVEIETELGGLFYLINFGIFLNLYGDFTTPGSPGISLSIWDFIALLGRCFLGKRVETDPIWHFLGDLSRQTTYQPGEGFEPPREWKMPREWLSVFPSDGVWTWAAEGGRLKLVHPGGFAVLDVLSVEADPIRQIKREIRDFMEPESIALQRSHTVGAGSNHSPLNRWLSWVVPYANARLGKALGLQEIGDIPHTLLEHRAKVELTPVHLNVTYSLAAHALEVRMAGLDRNPGWVPAAGRAIAFYYE